MLNQLISKVPPAATTRGDVADLVDALLAGPRSSSPLASTSRDRSLQSSPVAPAPGASTTPSAHVREHTAAHFDSQGPAVAAVILEDDTDTAEKPGDNGSSPPALQASTVPPSADVQIQTPALQVSRQTRLLG